MGNPLSKEIVVFLVIAVLAVGYVVMDMNKNVPMPTPAPASDLVGEAYQQPAKYAEVIFVGGSTSGELEFTNSDGQQVTIPFAADQTCVDCTYTGNQPVYYGTDAPVAGSPNIDELIYLEKEVCDGQKQSANVMACMGGYFLVLDKYNNAHLFQIGMIDLVQNKINFKDVTYGKQYNANQFTMNQVSSFYLGNSGFRLKITNIKIEFVSTGSGKPISLLGGKTLVLGGWSVDTQLVSPITFNAGKGEQEIVTVNYDADDKDTLIFDVEPKGTKYHINNLPDGFIQIKTRMTTMVYDKEDMKSVLITYKYY